MGTPFSFYLIIKQARLHSVKVFFLTSCNEVNCFPRYNLEKFDLIIKKGNRYLNPLQAVTERFST